MKKTLLFSPGLLPALLIGSALTASGQPGITYKKNTNNVCFNDGFYNWRIEYTDQGDGLYLATGTLNVDGINWTVYGWGNFAGHKGTVELHAGNPNADGCVGDYVDSLNYYGKAQITGTGSNTTFTGKGNWINYCSGNALTTGTWTASGPCDNKLKSPTDGPAKHGQVFSMKISPNPLKSTSTITYNLLKDSRVSITIYNYMQQPIKQIVNKTESIGVHSYIIDGSSLMNGSYRVVAVVDGKTYTLNLQVAR